MDLYKVYEQPRNVWKWYIQPWWKPRRNDEYNSRVVNLRKKKKKKMSEHAKSEIRDPIEIYSNGIVIRKIDFVEKYKENRIVR